MNLAIGFALLLQLFSTSPRSQYVQTDGRLALCTKTSTHQGEISNCAISANGRLIAVANSVGNVQIWDWRSNTAPTKLIDAHDHVQSFALSPNCSLIVIAAGGMLSTWTVPSGSKVCEIAVCAGSNVTAIVFSPDSKSVAFGTSTGTVGIVDIAVGKLLREECVNTGSILQLTYSLDGTRLISSGSGLRACTLDPRSLKLINSVKPSLLYTDSIIVLNTLRYVAYQLSPGNRIVVWDFPKQRRPRMLYGDLVGTSSAGKLLVGEPGSQSTYYSSENAMPYIRIVDPQSLTDCGRVYAGGLLGIVSCADDSVFATWNRGGSVSVWSALDSDKRTLPGLENKLFNSSSH